MKPVCVITSIMKPSRAVEQHAQNFRTAGGIVRVIGDAKSPSDWKVEGADFYSLSAQKDLRFSTAKLLPENHYSRKNIGYLLSIRDASVIYDTDDDNAPLPCWHVRNQVVQAEAVAQPGWVNAYRYFTSEEIWPRGYPIEDLASAVHKPCTPAQLASCVIQQGLADGSPDVDAIWRLTQDRPFHFQHAVRSVVISKGQWCPFNSQSTWWYEPAFPLLYLPSYCSFRMTDIWRSFIAQRVLWETSHVVAFHAPPEVVQDRNPHNLLRDFADEVPGYLKNAKIAEILAALPVSPLASVEGNMRACYEALVANSIFPPEELTLLDAWLNDLRVQQGYRHAAA